ncbi:hypothetical protein VNN36_07715 [Lactococcus garvieae]|uniref:hypothetical protein n=1 Tax=Lactococcus garvieae TaxID=1363 RepID=UPI0030D47008
MNKKRAVKLGIITGIIVLLGIIAMVGVKKMTEPSTEEKQIAFLKEHENEMTEYIQIKNPKSKISYVIYDWNSFRVEDSGAFTSKLYSLKINLYDKDKNKINGGVIGIIPNDIGEPTKINELSTNNFDKEIGESNNG